MKKLAWIATALFVAFGSVAVSVCAAPAKDTRARLKIDRKKIVKKFVYTQMNVRDRIQIKYPDLVVDDIRIEPGDPKATVVVTVRNRGTAQAHGFYVDMEISRGSELMVQWAVLTPVEAGDTRELEYDDLVALPGVTQLDVTVDPPTDDRPFGCQLEGVAREDRAVVEIPGEMNNTASATYSGDPTDP